MVLFSEEGLLVGILTLAERLYEFSITFCKRRRKQ